MTQGRESGRAIRVDAHQHFWRYSAEEYGWINDAMRVIRRDFLPVDLLPLLRETGVDATVAVQTCHSLEETEWLLRLAGEYDWIAGVVGWVSLADREIDVVLERFASDAKFRGVRHVLQAEPDEYMLRHDFNAGLARLRRYSLVYDALVFEHQLATAIQLVDRHPEQSFVLDHLAKPRIAAQEFEPWRMRIREMARRPHVDCKLSGMVTEADYHAWTLDDMRPYIETVLEAFGPERILFGSDWPVCTVASSYVRWVSVVDEFVKELSADEQKAVWGENAARVYRLQEPVSYEVAQN